MWSYIMYIAGGLEIKAIEYRVQLWDQIMWSYNQGWS